MRITPPVNAWWRSAFKRPVPAVLIMAAIASTLLGSAQAADLSKLSSGLPDMFRLVKATFLIFLFLYSVSGIINTRNCIRYSGFAVLLFLLYALMAIGSSAYSVNAFVSVWKGFEVLAIVMFAIYLAGMQRSIDDTRWLFDVISLTALFLVFTVLSGALLFPQDAFKHGVGTGGGAFFGLRGLAPIMNPATQGAVASLAATALLSPMLGRHNKPLRDRYSFLVLALVLIVIVMLLLARARTNIFAFAIAMTLVFVYSRRIGLAVISVCAGLVAFLSSDAALNFIYRGQTKEQFLSLTGRTQYWETLLEDFTESAMLGRGFYAAMRVLHNTSSVDNSYLEAFIGLGYIGLALLVAPIIVASYMLFKTRPKKGTWTLLDTVWVQSMAFFSIIVMRSFTSPTFASLHPMQIIYVLILVSIAAIHRHRKAAPVAPEVTDKLPDADDTQSRILSYGRHAEPMLNNTRDSGKQEN